MLTERVFSLVAASTEAALVARPRYGVDLVDEDDAGRALARLLEEVPHARRADADEHLDEVRAGHGEEGDVALTGRRLREERLAWRRRC